MAYDIITLKSFELNLKPSPCLLLLVCLDLLQLVPLDFLYLGTLETFCWLICFPLSAFGECCQLNLFQLEAFDFSYLGGFGFCPSFRLLPLGRASRMLPFWFHLHSIYLTSWFWLNLDHLPACTWQRMFWWNLECFSSTQLNSWTWDRTLLGVTFTQDYYFQQITNIILQKRCFLLKPDPACFGETGAAFLRLGWTPEHGTGVSLLLSPLHKISTSSKPPITFCISATKKMFPP